MGGCCGGVFDDVYLPLDERLLRFGRETYSQEGMDDGISAKTWIFTFYEESEACEECRHMLGEMNSWLEKYGFFSDPEHRVNWVLEEKPASNALYREMGFSKAPMHLFCDSKGRIFNMVAGIPDVEWMERHLLNKLRNA